MKILDELRKQGLPIPTSTPNPKKPTKLEIDCPKEYCQQNRKVSGEKTPLLVDIVSSKYVSWQCRHCLWSGHIGEKPEEQPVFEDDDAEMQHTLKSPQELPGEAVAYLGSVGLTVEEARKAGATWQAEGGFIQLPYREGGQTINALKITPSTGATAMASTKRVVFYGIEDVRIDENPVIICQREIDALILKGRGFPNVIGLPNGGNTPGKVDQYQSEPDKFAYLASAADMVQKWHHVVFVFDDTQEGVSLRQDLARRIGPGKCSAAKLSRKTVSATFLENGADFLCADVNEAKPLPIFGLFEVDDFEKELINYFEHGMSSGVSTGWHNVDQIYTVVPGQLTVVTGIPNSGKSEWVDALTLNLALNHNWRFAAFSPENGKEAHATKLIEKRVEMSADPRNHNRMSFDTFMSGAQWVKQHYTFIESTDTMPTLDWILERAKDAALRHGIKGLIIDPWNRIEKVLNGKSETDYVAESIPKILRFLVNYGVHCWLVVHPKQQQPDQKTGKIRAPSLYDMAGSAHFVNMCDNGIVVHRSEALDDTAEILVRKVRFKHVGRRGETKLKYNRNTGRYAPLEPAFTPEQYKNKDIDGIQTWEPEEE